MAKTAVDKYRQYASVFAQEAMAGAGATEQFPTSQTIRDRVGIEIYEMEINFPVSVLALLVGAQDFLRAGITQLANNIPTGALPYPNGVVGWEQVELLLAPSAVGQELQRQPLRVEFKEPILVHPASCFGFVIGNSLAAVASANIRMGFKYVELAEQDYADILQTVIAQNIL